MPPEPGRLIVGQVADPVLWNVPDIWTEAPMGGGWPIVAAKPTLSVILGWRRILSAQNCRTKLSSAPVRR